MSKFVIEPFFPDKRLNAQGWLTDFITSRLQRVGEQRSDLANLIYDQEITQETVKNFNIDDALKKEIEAVRARSEKDKAFYLNPLYYDAVERNTFISAQALETERKMRSYYKYMSNIKHNELSSFVPYARVLFAYKKPNEKNFKETPVPFIRDLSQEVTSILANPFSRGQGAGIRSISADRSFPGLGLTLNVEVNITYFFSSLSLATQIIDKIPEEEKFCYSKLFCFLNPKTQKVILEYGYGVNPKDENITYKDKDDIGQAEKKRLRLVYKSHSLNISDEGTVEVSVSYLSESEAQFFQKNNVSIPSLDFLQKENYLPPSVKSVYQEYNSLSKEYITIQNKIRDLQEQQKDLQSIGNQSSSKKDQLKDIEKQKNTLRDRAKTISQNLQSLKIQTAPFLKEIFIREIIRRRQMFSLAYSSEPSPDGKQFTINTYLALQTEGKDGKQELKILGNPVVTTRNLDSFKDIPNQGVLGTNTLGLTQQNLYEILLKNLFDGIDRPKPSSSSSTVKVTGNMLFFPLKALISIIYDFLPSDAKDGDIQYNIPYVCFGNVISRSFNREYSINIGDVLVEVEVFRAWLHKSFVQKERVDYSFSDILKDIVEELVPEALSRNNTGFYTKNNLGSIRHLTYYTRPDTEKKKDLLNKIYKQAPDFSTILELFSPEREKDAVPMLYYTQMLNPLNEFTSPYHRKYISRNIKNLTSFNLEEDAKYGIPHVSIGAAKGLVKKVSFSAMEQPYLATSLFQQSILDGDTTLPRYPYTVTVTMFGNNLFNQAGFLAVPPFGFGDQGADVNIGITGYYLVTKVSDKVSVDGSYETTINGVFHVNPLSNKQKNLKATVKDDASTPPAPKEFIEYKVEDYIKELLELDPTTLKSLGITASKNVSPKKSSTEASAQKKEKARTDQP